MPMPRGNDHTDAEMSKTLIMKMPQVMITWMPKAIVNAEEEDRKRREIMLVP